MSKRNTLIIVSCIFLAIAAVRLLPAIYTTRETSYDKDVPKEYFIDTSDDPMEEQFSHRNAACAVAYIMRYCGDQVYGNKIYANIDSHSGTILPSNLVKYFHDEGYWAKAFHGDLNTLKTRLSEGVPIIVCIRQDKNTHYAVLTGYDESQVYLADPMTENANVDNRSYNRIIENEEFLKIWKSDFLISDKAYIVAKKSAEP